MSWLLHRHIFLFKPESESCFSRPAGSLPMSLGHIPWQSWHHTSPAPPIRLPPLLPHLTEANWGALGTLWSLHNSARAAPGAPQPRWPGVAEIISSAGHPSYQLCHLMTGPDTRPKSGGWWPQGGRGHCRIFPRGSLCCSIQLFLWRRQGEEGGGGGGSGSSYIMLYCIRWGGVMACGAKNMKNNKKKRMSAAFLSVDIKNVITINK